VSLPPEYEVLARLLLTPAEARMLVHHVRRVSTALHTKVDNVAQASQAEVRTLRAQTVSELLRGVADVADKLERM
jgi:hypothetical protein